jgi:hypothetical protein
MTKEEFEHPAYLAGREAAVKYSEAHYPLLSDYPNPYAHGGNNWQLWNLGWNHQLMQHESATS